MSITVLKADYQDAVQSADIVSLLNAYAQDAMGGGQALDSFACDHLIEELSNRSYAFSVLAYVDGQAVGLVNCFEAFSTFKCKPLINIHDVIVLEPFRAQGISQLMLGKVEKIAREKNCCKITLEVLSQNTAAKSSYMKFGFESYELDPEMGHALFWQKNL